MSRPLYLLSLLVLFANHPALADIPATPVMTVYRFNGDLSVPYYAADDFARRGARSPAGSLTQGTSLIPCLVLRGGKPLTDSSGTPYVGFQIVVDSRRATPAAASVFKREVARRKAMRVRNHHCPAGVRHVINVRELYALEKAPSFDPPPAGRTAPTAPTGASQLDRIVRAFHASPQCAEANRRLIGRRAALERAWDGFIRAHSRTTSATLLARARHLDYTLRTALFEAHLDRGCNAYGACERNIIALSIRNRALERCTGAQGCSFTGDFRGVASKVSQYNIWDEYLTQISELTSCYLRPDLADVASYAKLQALYAQSVPDVERILYGGEAGLRQVFPGNSLSALQQVRHYYHAPAMGKCFPHHPRVEYISGAVARRGGDHALIANTRIQVGTKVDGGYRFQEFLFDEAPDRDLVRIVDNYPGFLIDARKVTLRLSTGCTAYGIPAGCPIRNAGRYRRTPGWLSAGRPIEINCRVQDRGENCRNPPAVRTARVGGSCDREMRPVAGVP